MTTEEIQEITTEMTRTLDTLTDELAEAAIAYHRSHQPQDVYEFVATGWDFMDEESTEDTLRMALLSASAAACRVAGVEE